MTPQAIEGWKARLEAMADDYLREMIASGTVQGLKRDYALLELENREREAREEDNREQRRTARSAKNAAWAAAIAAIIAAIAAIISMVIAFSG